MFPLLRPSRSCYQHFLIFWEKVYLQFWPFVWYVYKGSHKNYILLMKTPPPLIFLKVFLNIKIRFRNSKILVKIVAFYQLQKYSFLSGICLTPPPSLLSPFKRIFLLRIKYFNASLRWGPWNYRQLMPAFMAVKAG